MLFFLQNKIKAFSVAEATIALLIGSIALGMAAPMITKQIKQSNFTDTQFQVINSRIEQLQQALNDREDIFPSGFLMMTFESCPTNGWSDVSALYEGRFLKISSDAQVTHDAILPEHSHGVGFFSQSGNDDVYFWYKETIDSYRLKYTYNTRWVPGEAGYVSSLNKSANASISYGIVTTKEIYDADANTLEPKSITVKVCRRN